MREKFRRTHTGEECSEQLKGNINKMRIIEDLHTHTYYSHGKNGPRDNVLRALELGLEAVAVSEHAGGNMYYGVRGKKLERLNAELAELRREFDGRIRVLRGLECNVMNFGESDIPKDRSEYDVIILGYHKGIPPVNRFARHILFESFGGKSTPRRNTESLMAAAEKGHAPEPLFDSGHSVSCGLCKAAWHFAGNKLLACKPDPGGDKNDTRTRGGAYHRQ